MLRAAANSMARGRPSSLRQISPTVDALSSVTAKSGATACARAMKRRTESATAICAGAVRHSGSSSGGTGNSRSPASRSRRRLVARTVTPRAVASSAARWGAAATRRSKLSRTSRRSLSRRNAASRALAGSSPVSWTPNTAATVGRTRFGSASGARSTKRTPSINAPAAAAAASRARRVLPTPPGPVRVTSGTSSRMTNATIAASSFRRPIKRVRGSGSVIPASSPRSIRRGRGTRWAEGRSCGGWEAMRHQSDERSAI